MKSDIDIEYEKIYGQRNYPTIFGDTDDEYIKFRQHIIDTPRIYASSSKLPFEDIYDAYNIVKDIGLELNTAGSNYENINSYDIINALYSHTANILTGILSTLGGNTLFNTSFESGEEATKHIFWITVSGKCNAYGYLRKDTREFYIGEGAKYNEKEYLKTLSFKNRKKMIDKYGINTGIYIKLKRDVKCPNPIEAAKYVLGASVNMDLWKDSDNKNLYDVFPDIFFR